MKIALVGSNGRMGQKIIELSAKSKDTFTITPIDKDSTREQAYQAITDCDVVVDFSLPSSTIEHLIIATKLKKNYVIGTTGFSEQQLAEIKTISNNIAIVMSGNMSLGVNLLASLVEKAAAALQPYGFDISITETHHKYKIDKPSGTALLLGNHIKKSMDKDPNIEYNSIRGGTVIGDHSVIFSGYNERIILSHYAQDRDIFASGALKAASWVQDKSPAIYSMQDVLNDI